MMHVRKENSHEGSRDRSYRSRNFKPHLDSAPPEPPNRVKSQITILYDAFGSDPSMTKTGFRLVEVAENESCLIPQ